MTIAATVFWVFVILPHPTSVSAPHPTRMACEAARRRTFEPGTTMGCFLTTPSALEEMRATTTISMPTRRAGRR